MHRSGVFDRARWFGALAIGIVSPITTAQSDSLPSPITAPGSPDRAVGAPILLRVDQDACNAIRRADGGLIADLPLGDGTLVDARVQVVRSCTSATRFVVGTSSGLLAVDPPEVLSLQGWVDTEGKESSQVFVSIAGDRAHGFIETAGRMHLITSGPDSGPIAVSLDAIDLGAHGLPWLECATIGRAPSRTAGAAIAQITDAPIGPGDDSPEEMPQVGALDLSCRVLDVAIDTDFELTRDVFDGNVEAATAYVVTLMDAASAIFRRDLNVSLNVVFVRTWAENVDPYADNVPNLSELFSAFRQEWVTNELGVQRDIAHMISGRRIDSFAGFAVLGALCEVSDEDALPIDVSITSQIRGFFPFPFRDNSAVNFDIWLLAHELGHNLGAIHTSEASNFEPPLDGCGFGDCTVAEQGKGTIMSFCWRDCRPGLEAHHLRFHPRQIGERIEPELVRKTASGCISIASAPVFESSPSGAGVNVGDTLALTARASGREPIEYVWTTPNGTTALSPDPTLTIERVRPSDAGEYRISARNPCGTISAASVTVAVTFADCDSNGMRDDLDLAGGAPDANGNQILDACEGALPAPRTVAPSDAGGVPTRTPTLRWTPVRDATSYTVELDDDPAFGSIDLELAGLGLTSATVPSGVLVRNRSYSWRVRAIDDALGRQSVSAPARFSVFRPFCTGDANFDDVVDFDDIISILAHWGGAGPLGDANGDKRVNVQDVITVLGALWLRTCR